MSRPKTGDGKRSSGKKIGVKDILYVIFTSAPRGVGAISGRRPNHAYQGKGKR